MTTQTEALKALVHEMEYVLSCINEDKIPFDDDDFHEALRLGKEALAQPEQDPVAVTAEMARAFHRAISDGTLGQADEFEIQTGLEAAFACITTPPQPKEPEQEPVAWISVKDALPKAVRGLTYKKSITDTVLVRHSDRPDYPITAHAVIGEGLGAGISILTEGASEYPEIAWYSASSDLNNPFGLKNDDYERYLPRVFGSKITHWMPITTPPQRKPLTDEQIAEIVVEMNGNEPTALFWRDLARAIEAAHGIKE